MDIAGIRQYMTLLLSAIENNSNPQIGQLIHNAYFHRHWFTVGEIHRRLQAIVRFIESSEFLNHYGRLNNSDSPCRIAFYSEENIPLEEFFSVLTLVAMGHEIQYKGPTPADKVLRWIFEDMQLQGLFRGRIHFVEDQFSAFDKLIVATRNPWPETNRRLLHQKHHTLDLCRYQSVAVIPTSLSQNFLTELATDIFSYFGMGCGNVRKIFIPRDFDFTLFFQAIEIWYETMFNHHSYMNNYQYYQSVYLMNRIEHRDNGFLLLKEDVQHRAPTGVLFYEYYDDDQILRQQLQKATGIYRVCVDSPTLHGEISCGESVNQLFLPQEEIIDFVVEA